MLSAREDEVAVTLSAREHFVFELSYRSTGPFNVQLIFRHGPLRMIFKLSLLALLRAHTTFVGRFRCMTSFEYATNAGRNCGRSSSTARTGDALLLLKEGQATWEVHANTELPTRPARLIDVLLPLRPSLPNLRRSYRCFVRLVHRYYGTVRLLQHVHVRRSA